jgi:hypothetical protein
MFAHPPSGYVTDPYRAPRSFVDLSRHAYDVEYTPGKSDMDILRDLKRLNETVFGHSVFRQNQLEIMKVL